MTVLTKVCSSCKIEKDIKCFSRNKNTKDGYKYQCKECIKLSYLKNHDNEKEKRKQHYRENKSRYMEWATKARNRRLQKHKEYNKEWRSKNKETLAKYTAKYRAQKKLAYPSWANEFYIEEIYHLAHLRTKLTGIEWHVDHIIPLQGKNVCGLHVETNLQVIPGKINRQKSNKYVNTN